MESKLLKIGLWVFYITLILAILGFVAFIIVMFVKYANVPIGEVPTWIAWLFFGNK